MSISLMPKWRYNHFRRNDADHSSIELVFDENYVIGDIKVRGGYWAVSHNEIEHLVATQGEAEKLLFRLWLETEQGKSWVKRFFPRQSDSGGAVAAPIYESQDKETLALTACVDALDGAADTGAPRILRYLCDRFGVGATAVISSSIAMETAREEIRQHEIEAARMRVESEESDGRYVALSDHFSTINANAARMVREARATCDEIIKDLSNYLRDERANAVAAERERCAGKVDTIILRETWPTELVPAERLKLLADQIREGQ